MSTPCQATRLEFYLGPCNCTLHWILIALDFDSIGSAKLFGFILQSHLVRVIYSKLEKPAKIVDFVVIWIAGTNSQDNCTSIFQKYLAVLNCLG